MKPAWSFSSLTQFRNCPKQYHEVRVLKNYKETKDESALWGDRVHKAIHLALSEGVPLPEGMTVWQPLVEQFRGLKGIMHTELQLAINEGMQPCEWFARDTWCRAIVDGQWIDGHVIKSVDWKTGKQKPGSDQLALTALVQFAHHPEVDEIRTMFVWLKTGKVTRETYKRTQIPELWQLFLTDLRRLENAHSTGTWTPKTSGLCSQWCPVVTCQFNGKRRNW
jgi:hypothetical protein